MNRSDEDGLEPARRHDISMDKLVSVFHLPIAEASEQLGCCATVLKRICRRYAFVPVAMLVGGQSGEINFLSLVRCSRLNTVLLMFIPLGYIFSYL